MLARRLAALLSLLFLVLAASAQTPERPLRVLFLGNSLTAGNDVPGIVQALAQLHGVTMVADSNAPGGYALEDHWSVGHADLVRTGNYDLVVLQQGPSTLPESQTNLQQWTLVWTQHAHTQGTEAALFMVWPFNGQASGFELVALSYRTAAELAGIDVFPAGEAWQAALAAQPGIAFYSDDLHATAAGSLLAAMTIGRRLFSLDPARVPTQLPTRSGTISVSAATLTTFRAVVATLPAVSFNTAARPTPSPNATPPVLPPASAGSATRGSSGGGGSATLLATAAFAGCALARAVRVTRRASR